MARQAVAFFSALCLALMPSNGTAAQTEPRQESLVVAYLADGALVLLDTDSLRTTARADLAGERDYLIPRVGRYLAALGSDSVIVLLPPNAVVVLSVRPLQVARHFLAPPDARWRSISVGPRTGDIYLFGATANGGPLMSILDRRDGSEKQRHVLDRKIGPDWIPYYGIVDSAERRAYMSYHGSSTSGADVLSLEGDSIRECPVFDKESPSIGFGCLRRVHGALLEHRGTLLVATGTSKVGQIVVESGEMAVVETGIPGHLMEFDTLGGVLYTVAPCGSGDVVAAIHLDGRENDQGLRPFKGVCGSSLSAVREGVVVVGADRALTAGLPKGELLLVDLRDGSSVRLGVSAPAVDLLRLDWN